MKKIIKLGLCSLSSALAVSVAVTTTLAFDPKEKKQDSFLFDGRIFSSKEEILKYLIQYQKIQTDDIKVLGDLDRSYANNEIGLLNSALLPEFEPEKVKFAYFNAGGGITDDYEAAKKTYYNKGRVRTMYDDGFGGRFLTENQAKRSKEQHKMTQNILFYEDIPFIKSAPTFKGPVKAISNSRRFNPFNPTDFNDLKNNISNHMEEIIIDNIDYQLNGKDSLNNKLNLGYEIEVKNNENNVRNNQINFDLANYIHNQNSYIDIEENDNNGIKKLSYKQGNSANVHWEAGKKKVGTNQWGTENQRFSFSIYADKNRNSNKKLSYDIYNFGYSMFDWDSSHGNASLSNLTAEELLNILNLNYSDYMYWSKSYTKLKKSNIDSGKNAFKSNLLDIKNNSANKNVLIEYAKKEAPILNNDFLANYYYSITSPLINREITNIVNSIDQSETLFSINRLEDIRGWKHWTELQFYVFYFEYGLYIEHNGPIKEDIYYAGTTKANYALNNGNTSLGTSELMANLMSNNNPFEITIKEKGVPLFNTEIEVSDDGKLIIGPLQTANSELKNYYEAQELPQGKISLFDFFEDLYKDLKDLINGENNQSAIFKIMQKYFSDEYIDKYLEDPYLEIALANYVETTDYNDMLKILFTITKDSFNKYSDNWELIEVIASKLPDPNNILLFQPKETSILKKYSTFKGKYRLTSIFDFNPSLNEGVYSTSGIATTLEEWQKVTNATSSDLPAEILIAYDNNGQEINVGDYLYDQELIMEYNANNTLDPRRDYEHLFIEGFNGPVVNEVNIVHRLIFDNNEENKYYFKTFDQLKNYIYNYIDKQTIKM